MTPTTEVWLVLGHIPYEGSEALAACASEEVAEAEAVRRQGELDALSEDQQQLVGYYHYTVSGPFTVRS